MTLRVDYRSDHGPGITKRPRLVMDAGAISFLFWQLKHLEFQLRWSGCEGQLA